MAQTDGRTAIFAAAAAAAAGARRTGPRPRRWRPQKLKKKASSIRSRPSVRVRPSAPVRRAIPFSRHILFEVPSGFAFQMIELSASIAKSKVQEAIAKTLNDRFCQFFVQFFPRRLQRHSLQLQNFVSTILVDGLLSREFPFVRSFYLIFNIQLSCECEKGFHATRF